MASSNNDGNKISRRKKAILAEVPRRPHRMCAGCRDMKPKEELARLVIHDGEVYVDTSGKLPGRGVYVCRQGTCIQQALNNEQIQKSLKIRLDEKSMQELIAKWEEAYDVNNKDKFLNLLGIGFKGRRLACGNDAVLMAIKRKQALMLVLASDIAENSEKSLCSVAAEYQVPYMHLGTKEELGRVTGKAVRSAVAVLDGDILKGIEKLKINNVSTSDGRNV